MDLMQKCFCNKCCLLILFSLWNPNKYLNNWDIYLFTILYQLLKKIYIFYFSVRLIKWNVLDEIIYINFEL